MEQRGSTDPASSDIRSWCHLVLLSMISGVKHVIKIFHNFKSGLRDSERPTSLYRLESFVRINGFCGIRGSPTMNKFWLHIVGTDAMETQIVPN